MSYSAWAAIWPPKLDNYQRRSTEPVALPEAEAAVWKEYGLQESEKATFQRPGRITPVVVEAFRLGDSTGAVAAAQLLKSQRPGHTVHAQGNYAVVFSPSYRPSSGELEFWTNRLPGYKYGSQPTLTTFLPAEGRLPASERFVVGPASLAAYLPVVEAKAAAFDQFPTEAQVASYKVSGETDPVTAAIFRYPTPAIAKQQVTYFQAVPGIHVKRAGPTISLVLPSAPGGSVKPESADKILKGIQFDVFFGYTETVPTKMPDVAGLLIGLFRLVGFLILFALAGGMVVAAILFLTRRKREMENPAIASLGLENGPPR